MRLRVRGRWIVATRGDVIAAVIATETHGRRVGVGCRLVPNWRQPCSTVGIYCRLAAIMSYLRVVLSLGRSISLLFILSGFTFSLFSLLPCLPLLANFLELCRQLDQLSVLCLNHTAGFSFFFLVYVRIQRFRGSGKVWQGKMLGRTFRHPLCAMRLHSNMSIQVVQSAISLLAAVPTALVHALYLLVPSPGAFVLLSTGDRHETVYLHEHRISQKSGLYA